MAGFKARVMGASLVGSAVACVLLLVGLCTTSWAVSDSPDGLQRAYGGLWQHCVTVSQLSSTAPVAPPPPPRTNATAADAATAATATAAVRRRFFVRPQSDAERPPRTGGDSVGDSVTFCENTLRTSDCDEFSYDPDFESRCKRFGAAQIVAAIATACALLSLLLLLLLVLVYRKRQKHGVISLCLPATLKRFLAFTQKLAFALLLCTGAFGAAATGVFDRLFQTQQLEFEQLGTPRLGWSFAVFAAGWALCFVLAVIGFARMCMKKRSSSTDFQAI